MYDDILLPTDGSDSVTGALEEAVALAAATGARLHALYAVDTRSYSALSESQFLVEEALEEEGETAVDAVERRAGAADVPVTTTIVRGVPDEEIVAYATEHGVDLVVMGTHGRSGIEHLLLGSVAERVVRAAPVPVLVVRMADGT